MNDASVVIEISPSQRSPRAASIASSSSRRPALDARQQPLALGRELEVAAAAAQQRQLQVILERLDLHADRAGGDAERIGRAADAQVLRDGREDPQAADRSAAEGGGAGSRAAPGGGLV